MENMENVTKEGREFKVEDLSAGMVLHIFDANTGTSSFAMILPSKAGGDRGLCVIGPESWYPLECVGEDFIYGTDIIVAVFDVCGNNKEACRVSPAGRDLLWIRDFGQGQEEPEQEEPSQEQEEPVEQQ